MKPCFPFILIATLLAASLPWPAFPRQNSDETNRQKQENGKDRGSGMQAKNESERDADGVERVYDRDHSDYHRWDNAEDRAYHAFWEENHRAYRAYSSLNRREQSHYWKWRHAHSDTVAPSSASSSR